MLLLRASRPRRWRAAVAPLALAAPLVLGGCAVHGVTTQGREIERLYNFFLGAAAAVWVVVTGLMLWSIVRYRRRGVTPGFVEMPDVVTVAPDVIVRVSDDGPGIASEDLDHVFERFWHRRPPEGPMGSGLGLAIALATATACQGTVRAYNKRTGGAVFELRVPRVIVA